MWQANKCGSRVVLKNPLHLSGLLYEGGRLGWVVVMAGKGADPWADVDFDEVQEATCLEVTASNQISRGWTLTFLRWTTLKSFSTVSNCLTWRSKISFWPMISGRWWGDFPTSQNHSNPILLRAMGFRPTVEELAVLIEEIDEDGSGAIEFGEFAQLCAKFLVEVTTSRTSLKKIEFPGRKMF